MERHVTNVPANQVNFVIGLLRADGLTQINKSKNSDGTFDITGKRPSASTSHLERNHVGVPSDAAEAVTSARVSAPTAEFMLAHEAFIPYRYQDVADNATIGYGHHKGLSAAQIDDAFPAGITEKQAFDVFLSDLSEFAGIVRSKLSIQVNQHQFDALVMVAFGRGNINKEAPLVNAGKHEEVAASIEGIQTSGGQFNQGVANRYKAVADLYRHGLLPKPKHTREQLRTSGIQLIKDRYPDRLNYVGNNFDRATEPNQRTQAAEAYFRMTGETLPA